MVESKKTEWSFNLERAGAKESLKEPYGSKQDTMDVVVRSAQKGSTTQFEVYEKVSEAQPNAGRKRGTLRNRL